MPRLLVRWGGREYAASCPPGTRLAEAIRLAAGWFPLPCGGRGACGRCRVRVLYGRLSPPTRAELEWGAAAGAYRLACQARLLGDAAVEVDVPSISPVTYGVEPAEYELSPLCRGYCLAVDVGSSKIAAALVDCGTGATVSTGYRANPQVSWGVDVVARVERASEPGVLEAMAEATRSAISSLAREVAGSRKVEVAAVAGNAVALTIALGVDPSPLGRAPYRNPISKLLRIPGPELGLPAGEALALPPLESFVGSDAVSAAVAVVMHGYTSSTLVVDIGVNTEVVYLADYPRKAYAASAPAGPAIEGEGISCGAGGLGQGASYAAYNPARGGVVLVPPDARALAGSALVSLVASLRRHGLLDESGKLARGAVSLGGGLVLTQRDVRMFQMAKAAIGAACDALLHVGSAGLSTLVLAGTLGTLVSPSDAELIGLVPRAPSALQYGNLALVGAKLYLVSEDARRLVEEFKEKCAYVRLAGSPEYGRLWIRHLALRPFAPGG